ncbi:plastocyanin/azurin family copper-binding protein [Celeribacter sp.]|uniref:plastocyanin/azurin family copper-binding protein n=1 Tax=Celeribacter sp. TaxID=1890673 RepID=UPI003A8FC223
MTLARRQVLALGSGMVATLTLPAMAKTERVEVIEMRGTARGERVWFRPYGLAVAVGTTLRFVNRDEGNSHTATAYHPDIYDRTRRIPKSATPWDSDFLLPNESFEVTLTVPGVYDYYCIPHEMAAMVGRIVVGTPEDAGWEGPSQDTADVSREVLETLPAVADILKSGRLVQEDSL